jgi:formylmethanofuran dehydrogenase subunit D
MDLITKFQAANACTSVKIGALEVDSKYPIFSVERVTTRYGSTVLMVLRDSTMSMIRVFLPRRYASIITDDDIEQINSHTVPLYVVYKGTHVTTNSYIVAIEQ